MSSKNNSKQLSVGTGSDSVTVASVCNDPITQRASTVGFVKLFQGFFLYCFTFSIFVILTETYFTVSYAM